MTSVVDKYVFNLQRIELTDEKGQNERKTKKKELK